MVVNLTDDTLLGPQPEQVELILGLIYKDSILGSSAQSERERLDRNAKLKTN